MRLDYRLIVLFLLFVCLAKTSGFLFLTAMLLDFYRHHGIHPITSATTAPCTAAATTTHPVPVPTTVAYSATASGVTPDSGILCFSCTHMASDGSCTALSRCNAGEVCTVFHDRNGYTHRCLDATICSKAKALVPYDCWECCTDSLCNRQCAPEQCTDTSNCALLKAAGYGVCSDPNLAKTECKETCGHCG